MNENELLALLDDLLQKKITPGDVVDRLKHYPYENLGFARIDHHRALRQGFPEVIFGLGKTFEQVETIADRILQRSSNLLITHADSKLYERLTEKYEGITFHPRARCITQHRDKKIYGKGTVLVITAGTSDLSVAEEAQVTAEIMGNQVELVSDVGVAGIHRLIAVKEKIFSARVIVAVAGMEGALPSVVGGLAACPVIAVPTSIGYGAAFGGVAALLGMLNSCSSNVVVVNIDNGFGAGYVASIINRME